MDRMTNMKDDAVISLCIGWIMAVLTLYDLKIYLSITVKILTIVSLLIGIYLAYWKCVKIRRELKKKDV